MTKKKLQPFVQKIIEKRRALKIAEAEYRAAYVELHLAQGYKPEQVEKMVR